MIDPELEKKIRTFDFPYDDFCEDYCLKYIKILFDEIDRLRNQLEGEE